MKVFRLKADAVFRAESIDDAFQKLEEHFRALREGGDHALIDEGDISIMKVDE